MPTDPFPDNPADHRRRPWNGSARRPLIGLETGVVAIGVVTATALALAAGIVEPGSTIGVSSVLFGLLGLVAGGSPGRERAIEKLASDVENYATQVRRSEVEPDAGSERRVERADVTLERDDDIGRLSAAIDELAAAIRERERAVAESERYRRELYRIASEPTSSGEETIRRLLEFGCERLGVETGVVTRTDKETGREEIRTAVGTDFVRDGAKLARIYRRNAVASEDVLAVDGPIEEGVGDGFVDGRFEDGSAEGRSEADSRDEKREIGCYLGGRIDVGGDRDGTVCFVDREPRDEPFGGSERTFVELLIRWVRYEFERRDRERRERERHLERHRGFTADVIDAVDDVVYVLDEDGSLERWNESLSEATGYSADELDAMHALEFFDESMQGAIADAVEEAFETGEIRTEAPLLTSDGERIPYEFVASRLEDPDGNPVVAGVGRDVSERKEKERQLSHLIRSIPGLVYRTENAPGWPTEFVSEGARDVTGYAPEAIERGEVTWDDITVGRRDRIWEQVQSALAEREPFHLVFPIETADGERRWVKEQGRGVYADDGSVEALEGVIIDVTERKEHERELRRTADLLKQAERIAGVGGWELDLTSEPNDITLTDGLRRLYDLPLDAPIEAETAASFPHPDDRERVYQAVRDVIDHGESYDFEHRMQTASGDERWVHTIGEPVREDDGKRHPSGSRTGSGDGEIVAVRGTMQDITAHKERELALESLHDAARDLLGAETDRGVADLVVETAGDVLEAGEVALYRLDPSVNRLEPIAATDGFSDLCDGTPGVAAGDGDSALWNAFVTGAQTVIDDPAPFDRSRVFGPAVESAVVVPIGDHGVFTVVSESEPIDGEARRLVETLVATTEAAFDRLESEANLRARDAELEAQNKQLRRQIENNEIIRRIDQSLIGAESRDEIERSVPERLVESDDIAFAWIGGLGPSETALEARTWAGRNEEYLDGVSLECETSAEPAVRTARTETPTVVENVVDGLQEEAWRTSALDAGFQSAVSVPLAFEEYSYGVLTVYAERPDGFTDLERTVFTELGEGIANAINAAETRATLYAETLLELTLELSGGDDVLSRLATMADARVEYEGIGTYSAEETLLFLGVDGAAKADVTAALEELVSVTDYRLIDESNGNCLFEATVAGEAVVSRLVRHGGSPRSMTADGTRTELTVDVPPGTDVREFVEMLRDHDASVELRSRRHVERATHTGQELVTSLFDGLTDRQLEVLRTAYFAGFFEWPRESTGEEIAEMLDVTQPTVNRHLRIGQRRLLERLFESEPLVFADERVGA